MHTHVHTCVFTHVHTCVFTRVHTHTSAQIHFVNDNNITISIGAIVVGELQKLHLGNPSWPIIAGNLLPQTRHTENMSNALENNPRLQHAEERKPSSGAAGFAPLGVAWNTRVVSDAISRYCREGSVIGKCCPSRTSALFNKQCPLKKSEIYQKRNAVSRVPISVLELAETDLRFQLRFLLQLI